MTGGEETHHGCEKESILEIQILGRNDSG
jgi:hypothetical protein